MKKIISLVLALCMMLMVGAAFASEGNQDVPDTGSNADPAPAASFVVDTDITISGLTAGDDVYLYKVIEVNSATGGWKLTDAFAALGTEGNDNYSANVMKIVGNDTSFAGLTKEDVEKIANVAKAATKPTAEKVTGDTYTKAVDPGMYVALVAPISADTIYNPIIVSADYNEGGNSIASSATMGTSAVTKKQTVDLEKTTADITLDAGEIVKFTVTSTIPAYSNSYVNPKFNLSDTLSTGLKFVVDTDHPFTVSSGDVTYTGAPANEATSFTLTFNSEKIAALVAPQKVEITYYAQITNAAPFNINEETNDVTVEFSNNPSDDTDHGHKKDKVKEYTFSIDGTLFGNSDWTTGEVVKVGLDGNGKPIEAEINLDNGSKHAALDGAVFGLYTTQADATAGNDKYYTNSQFTGTVTTANGGLMNIKGLDEGTYYLKELSAPAGYIKDQEVHTIVIEAHKSTVEETETLDDGCEVKYSVEVVDSYTVKVDNKTSTFTMTLDGPSVKTVTPAEDTSEIVNTKGVELPSTGGIGTTIFYVLGGLLVVGAAVILVARRKADN